MVPIMVRQVCLGLVMMMGAGAGMPAAMAQVPPGLAAPARPLASFEDDVPPPTAYDRQLAEAPHSVQPETQGLLHLAGRLFAALIGVLALVYASLKFLLPRYFKKWSSGPGRELQLVERLSLDGHNAVVMVEMKSGVRLLLGTGEHGVQFLTVVGDEPARASFEDTLTAGQALGDRHKEERHAAEH